MNDWIEITKFEDIPRQGARVVELAHDDAVHRIALFRTATDGIYAVKDKCPHRGGPLSEGIVHGGLVTCPLHGFKIDLVTGEAVLPDKGCARTYAVKVEGGQVFLRLA
ncbi:MAG: nitrite reductase small subunit NirD [Betaproteobacteria bacterium]|nr:nitrite reductase small subunit NirD [Betaproteobacteria bacterium]